jgi:hypothetical protein
MLVREMTDNHSTGRTCNDVTNMLAVPEMCKVALAHEQPFGLGTNGKWRRKKTRKFGFVLNTCGSELHSHNWFWGGNVLFLIV